MTLLFHNCGQFTSTSEVLSLSCAEEMLPVFEKSYHKFFRSNICAGCHVTGGEAAAFNFAEVDTSLALVAFQKLDPDKIRTKLKAGHNGYTLDASTENQLNTYRSQWSKAQEDIVCSGSLLTASKPVLFFKDEKEYGKYFVRAEMTDWQTVTWDLQNDLMPQLQGAQVSLKIKVVADSFLAPEGYLIKDLQFKTPAGKNLKIQGVNVYLNNKAYLFSTFKGVDVTLNPSTEFQDVAPGASAGTIVKDASELYQNSDRWSLKIDVIDAMIPDTEE